MSTDKNKESAFNISFSKDIFLWGILIAATIISTIILHPDLIVSKRSYELGDVAEHDVKAPKNFFIEDREATESNRRKSIENVLTVYDHDKTLSSSITNNINEAFAELQKIIETEKDIEDEFTAEAIEKSQTNETNPIKIKKTSVQKKKIFEEKIGTILSSGAYNILDNENFSQEIANIINKILVDILKNGVVGNKEILLREQDKGIILRTVGEKTETFVNSLKKFYGPDQAKTMVRIIGQPLLKDKNYTLRNLIVDFSQQLISPNITLNRSETEKRKETASKKIKPVMYQIKTGEMILREGERVNTNIQLLKLKEMEVQTKTGRLLTRSIGTTMMLLCLLTTIYVLYIRHPNLIKYDVNKNVLFILTVFLFFIIIAKISGPLSQSLSPNTSFSIPPVSMLYGIPVAAGAMIICLFMGLNVALPFALVISVCTAIIFKNRLDVFIFFLLSSSMAAFWIQNCNERKVFIKAGLKLGLFNILAVTATDIFTVDFSGMKLFWDWTFAFSGGIVSGIVAAGLAPLVELAFNFTTDIKLLELANLDQPILRKLIMEAPGTYHHSIIVGNMVEAAASEIDANPQLARVCGYYHDIGKVKKPLYFIENQAKGRNRHDKLAPSMSSLILIEHIKGGVEIAKENKLGQPIIDTIRQHHGTSLISFFHNKAIQLKGEDNINIDDFRYPGPKPQTKEVALVMLADVIEAAAKTIDNPTPSKIQGLVQNLTNKIFSEGQLEDCELTLKDLNRIAKSFTSLLIGIYHHRIEYPDKLITTNGKPKNGNPDRQQTKHSKDTSEEGSAKGTSHLKRLGQS
ncbi:MAG: HDIG domain-containing protein [Desulfobacterales bacterium]|jgi:cyclic-di-AMP phosphodiesterase PgpH|nr:HDIG domain-containing protein [Desulfobacteraceae bacterium]MBT4365317.1 HDIG domain-containing protein [Desulfobacteraceae bacterium]MBT7085553.1 HDIG domain-containing protein [Desulfobacterales bacterium]MBT7695928.1 HDIG domain-containing protein [Desulfobacterales bacterium]